MDGAPEVKVGQTFEVTEAHVTLLRASWWRWEDIETGAPAMDPKRPYGNGDVEGDVIEMLGWQGDPDDVTPRQDREDREKAARLHGEMLTVMQIVTSLAGIAPGTYERLERPIGAQFATVWRRV